MNPNDDLQKKWFDLWAGAARGVAEGVKAAVEAARPAQDPAAIGRGLAAWGEAAADFARQVASGLDEAWLDSLDARAFSQLRRVAAVDWQAEMSRWADAVAAAVPVPNGLDPARLEGKLRSTLDEYRRDLSSLPETAFQVDFRPVLDAFARVARGEEDPEARKVVSRVMEAAAVKTRLGAEHYADPAKTPVAPTPRERIRKLGRFELYRFRLPAGGAAPAPRGAPVLIVYSVINRSYILDLSEKCSFVRHLLDRGHDVYLVEWGEAVPGDRETTLDTYVDDGIGGCVDAIREVTGAPRVALFGHCIGGTLAALHAARRPDTVDRVVFLTVPFTRASGGVVSLWTDPLVFPVDPIVDRFGLMPAKLVRYTFMALKPYYEVMKWKMFLENVGNDAVMEHFHVVDRWANDNVDIPGEVFRKFVHEVFQEDRLLAGETTIRGEKVDLGRISRPVLNLAGAEDWIVPPDSAEAVGRALGGADHRFVRMPGSHLAVILDPRLRGIWDEIAEFLAGSPPTEDAREAAEDADA